jgi:predicted MPP superfamily phosphohydrolase
MNRLITISIFFILYFLLEWYGYQSIKTVFKTSKYKEIATYVYFGITIFFLFLIIFSIYSRINSVTIPFQNYLSAILLGILIGKLLLCIFLGIEDLARVMRYGFSKYSYSRTSPIQNIDRSQFLNSLFLIFTSLPLAAFCYGVFKTAYDYKIHRKKIFFDKLPKAFDGLRIVQISDVHAGSLNDYKALKSAVEKINELEADLFFFTGDLVNNIASEFTEKIEIFKNIKAKIGKFSILGNHDYGDYYMWNSSDEKVANLDLLKSYHKQIDWKLLLNEHVSITKNESKIEIIGVENWSGKLRFKQYGDLKIAYEGLEKEAFKILLSHDPSHWDIEVAEMYNDIDLTLSGHTHGMQFGVETKWFRFSPVQFVYKHWAGLYQKGKQYLYVNRGFGFIGYQGRVGIRPEITLIELYSK